MSILRVEELTKSFPNTLAVNQVNLLIKEGEVLGLLGPNGAGKSTVISMISSLTKSTHGDIFYKDVSVMENPQFIRKELGYVPQEIALYSECWV